MRFLYKIHSGYDGFRPAVTGQRLADGFLPLGWKRYLDAVNESDEVWVYFYGPHRFEPGVYIKGRISSVSFDDSIALLRIDSFDPEHPVLDSDASERVASVVARRYRQVFLYPDDWESPTNCDLLGTGKSCEDRDCGTCIIHQELPLITPDALTIPPRITRDKIEGMASAYWIRPNRCYLAYGRLKEPILRTTKAFTSFKVGNERLAFPFALGIRDAIRTRGLSGFDCLVPIPLSPDKMAAGEVHRTKALADELRPLLHLPVIDGMSLAGPISKRRVLSSGASQAQFERRYLDLLQVDPAVRRYRHALLIDDVATHGSTLEIAASKLRAEGLKVTLGTGGQMILKSVVKDDGDVLREL